MPRRAVAAKSAQSLERLTGSLLQSRDDERRRIARELHDTTAQNLLAIVINLETLVQKDSTLSEDFVSAVSECQSLCPNGSVVFAGSESCSGAVFGWNTVNLAF